MEKKTNKAKFEIFKFLRISALSLVIMEVICGGNYALSANSIKICLLGYFCMQNSYLRKTVQNPTIFMKNAKKKKKKND